MTAVRKMTVRLARILTALVLVASVFNAGTTTAGAQDVDCDSLSYAELISSPCVASLDPACAALSYAELISSPCAVATGGASGSGQASDGPASRGDAGPNSASLVAGLAGMVAVGAVFSIAARRESLAPLDE